MAMVGSDWNKVVAGFNPATPETRALNYAAFSFGVMGTRRS